MRLQEGAYGAAANVLEVGYAAAEALTSLLPNCAVVHRLMGQVCAAAADVCPSLFGTVAMTLWQHVPASAGVANERAVTFLAKLGHMAGRGAAALSHAVRLDARNWQCWCDLGTNLMLQVGLTDLS